MSHKDEKEHGLPENSRLKSQKMGFFSAYAMFSTIMALASPPPIHKVAKP